MGKLQRWMDANDLTDREVAVKVLASRVHICRIRNGLHASVPLAKRLGRLTGIAWTYFADPPSAQNAARR